MMSDHDHEIEHLLHVALLVFTVAALFARPCPPSSALGFVWMMPPYQCVQVVGGR